jgi:hypothetical protein
MALVISLILMVVLTLLGLASSLSSNFEVKLSGNKRGSTDAFYAADSGTQVVIAHLINFDLPGKYSGNKYEPFSDNANTTPNPTHARVFIEHFPDQTGAPRGLGISATQVNFEHYLIESTGEDQIDTNLVKSNCVIQQKVVRLVPTLQGGF